VNFCTRCGAQVSANYCRQCGAATTSDATPDLTADVTPVTLTTPTAPAFSRIPLAAPEPLAALPVGATARVETAPTRRSLANETRWVMVAFLVPVVISAVLVLAQHVAGVENIARFPSIVRHHPLTNMALGILAYLPVAAVVPLALFLLSRTGQNARSLGLDAPSLGRAVVPGLGLGAASFAVEFVAALVLIAIFVNNKSLFVSITYHGIPKYYLVWGIAVSAITAVTEEVLVNGYLITRLEQLGWTPRASLTLSLVLRTSYHVYYGLGFLLTIPFGFFVTRSFQKHHKLSRPIMAHFLYDAILFTIVILH
jgi:membrane protease YdiL (CAAX protease family)